MQKVENPIFLQVPAVQGRKTHDAGTISKQLYHTHFEQPPVLPIRMGDICVLGCIQTASSWILKESNSVSYLFLYFNSSSSEYSAVNIYPDSGS